MISRFINLFKKSDIDEQRAFQSKVLSMVRDLYPEYDHSATDDPLTLTLDGKVLGLTNVRATFLLSDQTDADLREIVADHFQKLHIGLGVEDLIEQTWGSAKPNIMPQLMPVNFLTKVPLVSFPFGAEIVIGFVIDSEQTYTYVSKDDVERWDISEQDVLDSALENLDARSRGIEMTQIPGSNGIIAINTMDGFDAARIISPKLRDFCGGLLGMPFYFGVPNRDFLICWSMNDDEQFQSGMRLQTSTDCEERPYPLSSAVFRVLENGEIEVTSIDSVDPRAVAAENN